MNSFLLAAGWLLRASALICITWIAVQVATGALTDLPTILSSVVFHGIFAASGVTLVGLARTRGGVAPATGTTPAGRPSPAS